MSILTVIAVAVLLAGTSIVPLGLIRPERRLRFVQFDAGLTLAAIAAAVHLSHVTTSSMNVVFAALVIVRVVHVSAWLLVERPDGEPAMRRAALVAMLVYAAIAIHQGNRPTDGDESYYVLIAESIVDDFDLDLRNQYANAAASAAGRADLRPQTGDPIGPNGEQYSRHAPTLPILLIPGLLAGGLAGAGCIIAIFGGLTVGATLHLARGCGVTTAALWRLYPLLAFGPPLIFYSTRIWPEVPAAFFFALALVAVQERRPIVFVVAIASLGLLKLRLLLIAGTLLLVFLARLVRRDDDSAKPHVERRTVAALLIGATLLILPFLIARMISGTPLNVHQPAELLPQEPAAYARGAGGLLFDGQGGMLFQAPLLLLGVIALARWTTVPFVVKAGAVAALPYILLLLPRAEWHGGWSPPLRYIVVFTPLLAAAASLVIARLRDEWLVPLAVWTFAVAAHGTAYPWRLFHIANGESTLGEWLSRTWGADVSRLIPSYIRPNDAAWIVPIIVLALISVAFALRRRVGSIPRVAAPAVAMLLLLALPLLAAMPGRVVHFEDSHVDHRGGELHPYRYAESRFLYTGGWTMRQGDVAQFAIRNGTYRLHYRSEQGATILLDQQRYLLPATGEWFSMIRLDPTPRQGKRRLEVLDGIVTFDRIEHE